MAVYWEELPSMKLEFDRLRWLAYYFFLNNCYKLVKVMSRNNICPLGEKKTSWKKGEERRGERERRRRQRDYT